MAVPPRLPTCGNLHGVPLGHVVACCMLAKDCGSGGRGMTNDAVSNPHGADGWNGCVARLADIGTMCVLPVGPVCAAVKSGWELARDTVCHADDEGAVGITELGQLQSRLFAPLTTGCWTEIQCPDRCC